MPDKNGGREGRLNVRMDPGLKSWFKNYAHPLGGMSEAVHQYVEKLYRRNTGTRWKGQHGHDGKEEAGSAQRGSGDPPDDAAGTDGGHQ